MPTRQSTKLPTHQSTKLPTHQSTKLPTHQSTKPAEFIAQTWAMVNAGHAEINWDFTGTQIVVSNAERLAEHILPLYFRHGQYSSWVRGVNAYGFRKLSAGRWSSPSFLRSKPELIVSIRRKPAPAPPSRAKPTSTALVRPQSLAPLVTPPQQQWMWMQAEMSRLNNELLSIRRDEFLQRFNFVRLMQMLLKKGVAPTFLPAFRGMNKCQLLANKCKLLQMKKMISCCPQPGQQEQRDSGTSVEAPLSKDAAAVMLQRAMRFKRAVSEAAASPASRSSTRTTRRTVAEAAAMPPSAAAAAVDGEGVELRVADVPPTPSIVALSDATPAAFSTPLLRAQRSGANDKDDNASDASSSLGDPPPSLPTIASPSRMSDIDLDELGLDYRDYDHLVRGGVAAEQPQDGGMYGSMLVSKHGSHMQASSEVDAMSDAASTPVAAGGGRHASWAPPAANTGGGLNDARSKQQRCDTLKLACLLAAMPQLPASTSKLPPEGSSSRAQIEAAVHFAFKKLTISSAAESNLGERSNMAMGMPPAPMLVSCA